MKPIPDTWLLLDFHIEAQNLLHAYHRGERSAFAAVRQFVAGRGKRTDLGMPVEDFDLATAQEIVARNYGFESWEKLTGFIEELRRENSAIWQFEAAVESIIGGDEELLKKLLQENPALVTMRSSRVHQATLLLYTGANGVEGFRQRSPRNAALIAELLLKAGAGVDAEIRDGGRGTTLGEVATSEHTAKAGVQIALMEVLMKYGARIDGDPEGWQPLIAALDNARPEAAEWLAAHGATLTIGSAAGIGRLDLVEKFFDSDGRYRDDQAFGKKWRVPASAGAQLVRALMYAAIYGHTGIVAFLIDKGVDIGAQDDDQYTALHWAAHSGHIETVEWLLRHQAPLEKKNCYDGTVLGQVIWSATNHAGGWGGNKPGFNYLPIIQRLIAAGAVINPWWITNIENIDNLLRSHTKRPMPQCHKIMPGLPMSDVPSGVAWYRDLLGFSVNYQQDDIGVIDRDKARILLIARTEKHTGIGSCYVYVNDADALYTEFRAKGVPVAKEPVSQPWGLREFEVIDPEGNSITFGQPFE
jgi:hypothetical protein